VQITGHPTFTELDKLLDHVQHDLDRYLGPGFHCGDLFGLKIAG
jgi:hypothetical protein